jgi:hypothetical protein
MRMPAAFYLGLSLAISSVSAQERADEPESGAISSPPLAQDIVSNGHPLISAHRATTPDDRVCVTYIKTDGTGLTSAEVSRDRLQTRSGEDLLAAAKRMFAPYNVLGALSPYAVCTGPRPYPLMPPFFSKEEEEQEILESKIRAARQKIKPAKFDRPVQCDAKWYQVCNRDFDRPDRAEVTYFYLQSTGWRFCSAELYKITGNGIWLPGPRSKTRIGVILHAIGSQQPWDQWGGNIVVGINATLIPDTVEEEVFRVVCPYGPG